MSIYSAKMTKPDVDLFAKFIEIDMRDAPRMFQRQLPREQIAVSHGLVPMRCSHPYTTIYPLESPMNRFGRES
jgi:hypothetical protein